MQNLGAKIRPDPEPARWESPPTAAEAKFLIRYLGSINGDDLEFNSFRGKSITRSFIFTRDTY